MDVLHHPEHADGERFTSVNHSCQRLRLDLQRTYPRAVEAVPVFATLASTFERCSANARAFLCGALPIITTWSTFEFVSGTQVAQSIDFMLDLHGESELQVSALDGVGGLSNVVLDQFQPFLPRTATTALDILENSTNPEL